MEQFNEPMFFEQDGFTRRDTLSAYTAKTFGWMALGLLVTFGVAYLGYITGAIRYVFFIPYAPIVLALAEVAVVIFLSARISHLSIGGARALFFLYSALNGITFSTFFLLYEVTSLVFVFGITALYFGVLAAYGYFTKRDLSGLRNILFAGLLFMLVYWVAMIFLPVPLGQAEKLMCFIGLAIFMGYTAYDTQKIKAFYTYAGTNEQLAAKGSVICALQLYLDFINIFLYILRLVGRHRD